MAAACAALIFAAFEADNFCCCATVTCFLNLDVSKTDIAENDGRIAKCRIFGCTFSDEAAVEIPEKVTVWKYVPQTPIETAVAKKDETVEKCLEE